MSRDHRHQPHLVLLGAVALAGPIAALLDAGIVNVGIERLADSLDASVATVQWTTTAYLLTVATAIPVTGWATDRYGGRAVWLAAMALFTLASALCAVAWSAESLIAFRALQGFGGGALEPTMLTIITRAAGPERAGRAVGMVGAPLMLGPALGPLAGGLILEHLSWHWMFLVNVPIGLVAVPLAWRVMPGGDATHADQSLDARGVALLVLGAAGLVLGFSQLAAGDAAAIAVAGLAVGVAALVAYPRHATSRGRDAIVDLALIREPGIGWGLATVSLLGLGLFAFLFTVALDLQTQRGYGPLGTGLLLLCEAVGAAVGFALAGRGLRALALPGALVFAATALLLGLPGHLATAVIGLLLALGGLGLGLVGGTAFASVYSTATPAQSARVGTAIFVVQQVAAAVGVAVATLAISSGTAGGFTAAYVFIAVAGCLAAVAVWCLRRPRPAREAGGAEPMIER